MKKIILLSLICLGLLPLILSGQARLPDQEPVQQPVKDPGLIPMDIPKKKKKMAVDSTLRAALGDQLINLLLQPESIEAHQVSPFVAENEGPFQLEGFQMLSSTEMTADQRSALIDILGDSRSFLFTDMQKLCYFLPEMGFMFNGKSDNMAILVSTQCDLLRIYYTGEEGTREFTTMNVDPAHSRLQALYLDLFPNLPEVQPEKEMESLGMQLVSEPVYYKVRSGEGWSHIAVKASRQFEKEVGIKDICKLNNIAYEKAIQNKVFPLIGEQVIIGFK